MNAYKNIATEDNMGNEVKLDSFTSKELIEMVNKAGTSIASDRDKLRGGKNAEIEAFKKYKLDTHAGRKNLLAKAGITAETPENFRVFEYVNKEGQHYLFKGNVPKDAAPNDSLTVTDIMIVADSKANDSIVKTLGEHDFK